jgi:Xaa-Pro aminopeptidase
MSIAQQTDRADRLTGLLPEAEVDAVLVTDLINVRYLTGYTGSNGLALVGPESRIFVTDFRYVQQAAEEVDPTFERRRARHELTDGLEEMLPGGPLRLGFEEEHVSYREHARLRAALPERIELVPVEGLVERLRAVKDVDEVMRIQEATKLADAALEDLLRGGLAGRTEHELAFDLEVAMRRQGAEGPSFPPIVAAGQNGALPHATPREVEVTPGQMVVIDWGAKLGGYCSDCTRTLYVGGSTPSDQERDTYNLVLRAQLAGLDAVSAGASTHAVDSSARTIIEEAGHGEEFGHGLGHGVGLDIHEAPRLSPRGDSTLVAGHVVTVEPGVYLPGEFGVRIEDLVVVTEDGPTILTGLSKEFTVVD